MISLKKDKRLSHTRARYYTDFSEGEKRWFGCEHVAIGTAIKFHVQENHTILCPDCLNSKNTKLTEICFHCFIENIEKMYGSLNYDVLFPHVKGLDFIFAHYPNTYDNRLRSNYYYKAD